MEKHRSPEWTKNREETGRRPIFGRKTFSGIKESQHLENATDLRAVVEEHLREKARKESRFKWTGRGLILVGVTTLLGSCPLQMMSMMALHTISVELILFASALVGGGVFLTMWRPKLQDTTEALIVAVKYDNKLTAARLALEIDISFDKAEKIIQELVRSGVAEIDLDHAGPDHAITYKVRGI